MLSAEKVQATLDAFKEVQSKARMQATLDAVKKVQAEAKKERGGAGRRGVPAGYFTTQMHDGWHFISPTGDVGGPFNTEKEAKLRANRHHGKGKR